MLYYVFIYLIENSLYAVYIYLIIYSRAQGYIILSSFCRDSLLFLTHYVFLVLFSLQWGYVVVTTPNGVLDHEEAIRQNVGGQVLGYFH